MSKESKLIRDGLIAGKAYATAVFGECAGGCFGPADFTAAIAALDRIEAREGEKTVPMDMLIDLANMHLAIERNEPCDDDSVFEISARYGYKVTE